MAMSGKVTHPLIIVIALCFILWIIVMPLAISRGPGMPFNESIAEWHIQLNPTTNSTTNSTENSTSNTPIAAPSQNATA
jgi:hypothetical protein